MEHSCETGQEHITTPHRRSNLFAASGNFGAERWLDQWCLRKLLGIKRYHHVQNDEVRRTTGQPRLSAIVQERRLSLFGHTARMPNETDVRSIITASPSENWRKPPGRPRTTWMKTIQQDLRSKNLSLDEAITVAQNRPLWRLISAFGATHP